MSFKTERNDITKVHADAIVNTAECDGGAIHHIGNVHKYAREEDRPEKTIFVITTDVRKMPARNILMRKFRSL